MTKRADVYDGDILDQAETQVLFLEWANILEVFVGKTKFLVDRGYASTKPIVNSIIIMVDNIAIWHIAISNYTTTKIEHTYIVTHTHQPAYGKYS